MPTFTPTEREIFLTQLLARRAAGETFGAIAATPGWPSRPTLRKWLRRRPDLDVPQLRARPTRWSAALSRQICNRILAGQSLRAICADPAMPDRKSVDAWARARPGFARRLADARERSGAPRTGRASRFGYARDLIVAEMFPLLCRGATLDQVCSRADYPNKRTLYDWRRADPEIARQIELGMQIWRWTLAEAHFPMLQAMERELRANGPPKTSEG